MDVGIILKGLGAILGGGATGLVGSIVTNVTNFKSRKLELNHEERMVELEKDAMIAEKEMNIAIQESKTAGEISIAEMEAYKKSIELSEKSLFKESYMEKLMGSGRLGRFLAACIAFGMGCCDIFKGFIRPSTTTYFIGLTTYLTYKCIKILEAANNGAIKPEQAYLIFENVVYTLLYLTTTCVSYYFCDRGASKFVAKRLNG